MQVASHCKDCGIKFGRYFCMICRLYDDQEKGQFHCNGCGICRCCDYVHCYSAVFVESTFIISYTFNDKKVTIQVSITDSVCIHAIQFQHKSQPVVENLKQKPVLCCIYIKKEKKNSKSCKYIEQSHSYSVELTDTIYLYGSQLGRLVTFMTFTAIHCT